jgi:tetratricopeptide (TPR) repeat protein
VDLTGERIGRYEIIKPLGQGGMGAVYLAEARKERTRAAIKVLHPHLLAVPGAFKRFMREAQLGQQIDHPNVVRTLDVDALMVRDQQIHFLIMDYVEGQTLAALLNELGSAPEELCRHIGRQVADALTAIHAAGAVHRDLKPANVTITPDNEIKVMDFGISLLRDPSHQLTEVGEFLGSVLYAAPEQWNPEATVDARIDLFALGILLYELSTGRHPFAGQRDAVPPSLMTSRRPEPASVTRPELSPFFVELIAKLVEVDPDDRFASAEVTRGILESGERSQWWHTREVEVERSGRTRARRIQVTRDAGVHGRERELGRLRACMEVARTGSGQVVLLEGESGIGKTRLVDEFLRLEEIPAKFLFGSYPPGGAATAEGALSTAFREHFGHGDLEQKLAPILPELSALVPAFAALLRGEALPDERNRLSTDAIASAFTETIRAIAQDEPVVLLLDDLHFAPSESRALFARIARAVTELPVLLVGAYRPDAACDWASNLLPLEHVSHLALQRLTPGDLAKLLADALGSSALADQLGWEIARKSDGNPFFVFEILRELRVRKQLVRGDDGSWRTTGLIRQIDTPHSVREIMQGRLRKLEDIDRDLLDVASCCGFRFDPAVVAAANGTELIPALKRFRRLERDHSILRPDGREYVFDHHQMQEAIYAGLFEQLREQYHAAIGEACEEHWTEPADAQIVALCEHYLKGGRADRAGPFLPRAIHHLRASNLFESVSAITSMALDAGEPSDPAARFEILSAAAEGANMAGDWEAESRFNDEQFTIAEELDDDRLRAQALVRRGNHLYAVAEFAQSIAAYNEAGALADALDDDALKQSAERGLGINYSRMGDRSAALKHQLLSLDLCRKLGMLAGEAAAHNNIAIQYVDLDRTDEAEEHYARAIELAKESGERRWEANAFGNWGRVHFDRGQYDRSWECATRFRELTRLIGDRRGEFTSGVILCTIWQMFGSIEEMEHELARIEEGIEETRDRWLSGYAIRHRGWIAEQRRELKEAERLYEKALNLRREVNDRNALPDSMVELGSVLIELGRQPEGKALIEESLTIEEKDHRLPAYALSELCVADPARLEEARAALAALQPRGTLSVRAPYCFWRASGDRADLEQAHAKLRDLQTRIPEEYRRSSLERVWTFRAVAEAWDENSSWGTAGG